MVGACVRACVRIEFLRRAARIPHPAADSCVIPCLRPWPFLLALEQCVKGDVGDFDNLEADAGNVTDSMTLSAEASYQYFVVLLDEIQTAIPRHEGRNLLAILDQLDTDALSDGRVGLFRLHTNLRASNPKYMNTYIMEKDAK